MAATALADVFRPPINRSMRSLDRNFFRKKIPLAAAKISDNKKITQFRKDLGQDLLRLERYTSIKELPGHERGTKALLLNPNIGVQGGRFCCLQYRIIVDCLIESETWSSKLLELVKTQQVALVPYEVELDYDYWTYRGLILLSL